MGSDKSLATERVKQKKLYKIRILLFGCRKDSLKNALSGDSLDCTPKSSQLVDVVSCSSDLDRIPAGSAQCGCQMDLNSARSSTLNISTHEVFTQTGDDDDDMKSINENGPDAFAQDGADRKDAGTQLSFSELSNNSSRAFIQVQYSTVTKKFQAPCNLGAKEDEPQSETASICEELSKTLCTPRSLVDGSLSRLSGASSKLPRSPTGNQPTRSQPPRGQAVRNQPPRGQQPQNNPTTKRDKKSSKSQPKPAKRQPAVAFEPQRQNRPYQPAPPAGERPMEAKNSAFPGPPTTQNDEEIRPRAPKQDQQSQCEEGGEKTSACQISELLQRVCQLEAKLRQQERALRGLQCSMQSGKPPKCPPPSPCCCKPKCCDQCTQKSKSSCSLQSAAKSCKSSTGTVDQPPAKECCACPKQSPPKCEVKPDCKALKKEFIDIFTRKDPTECTEKDCACPIKICPKKNNCIDARKMCLECLEKSDVLMHQFNHMFVNPGSRGLTYNLNKPKKNKAPSLEKFNQTEPEPKPEKEICKLKPDISSSLHERESKIENILDKCIDLVATKSRCDVSNIGMVSSASCLTTNDDPKPFDSRQCLQKEVYESLMEQFVKFLAKPRTECGLNPLPAQKADGEPYSFDRLCTELISLISNAENLKSRSVMNEDELVTTSSSNTVLEKDQAGCQDNSNSGQSDDQNEKPCKVKFDSNDPSVSSGGCQSCSDNGNLPILSSLVGEMTKLIGSRPFQHVVLTIMRQGCNVYHINIRERATGNVLGCILANGSAVNEAINLGLFEDIPTFCELNRRRATDPRDCPADAIAPPQREPGGETQLAKKNKAKAMEFVTRVLGLPVVEAERFFSLTSALKTAKKSSDQRLGGAELPRVTENTGLIGRGAVADNLIFLGATGSQLDVSELGEASKHFLRLLSGLDTEDKEKH